MLSEPEGGSEWKISDMKERNQRTRVAPAEDRTAAIPGKPPKNGGVLGGSNSRPPAPKAGILPLDQTPGVQIPNFWYAIIVLLNTQSPFPAHTPLAPQVNVLLGYVRQGVSAVHFDAGWGTAHHKVKEHKLALGHVHLLPVAKR